MKINPESMARASSRHPWRVIGLWGAFMVAMIAVSASLLGGVLTTDIAFTNKPESIRAQDIVDKEFSAKTAGKSTEYVIVSGDSSTIDDPAFQAYVQKIQGALVATNLLAEPPATYYNVSAQSPEAAAGLVSQDKHYTLIPIAIVKDDVATIDGLRSAIAKNTADGFTTQLAGQATLNADFTTIAEQDAKKGESIGIMVALVVLVVVFGAIVAALLPVGMGIFAIAVALGMVALVGQIVQFNLFVTNII